MKILGIDDNTDINNLMKDVLEAHGHNFTFTNNGREGVKLISEQQFDAVFLDVAMPEFSGIDVVDALLKEGIIKKQPVILFTASSITNSEIQELIKKGVYSCIRKPVEIDALILTLKNLNSK